MQFLVVSNGPKEGGGEGAQGFLVVGGRRPLFLVEISHGDITQTATKGYFLARIT